MSLSQAVICLQRRIPHYLAASMTTDQQAGITSVSSGRQLHSARHLLARCVILAITATCVLWFCFSAKALLLNYPPVWPDEACFANPAINLLQHGHLSTDLLQGALPGIEKHTYWMPPLYFIYLAGVFLLAGPSLEALRIASLVPALGLLVLTYVLARRVGLGRWLSLLPIAILTVDAVFLRGALVGRMDMLALFLTLLALWFATTGNLRNARSTRLFVVGVICGLPAMVHPVGAIAPASVFIWFLLSPETRTRRCILLFLAGLLVVALSWLCYILVDPSSFLGQFGAQLARKSARHTSLHSITASVSILSQQYAAHFGRLVEVIWAPPLLLLGIIGLILRGRTPAFTELQLRNRRLLLCCELLAAALVLWGGEMWYLVYLIPIAAIGLCLLLRELVRRWPSDWEGIGVLLALIGIWICGFVWINVKHVVTVKNSNVAAESDYKYFSGEISQSIPSGSRVLLAIVPDPYFVLRNRPDLVLREYVPDNLPVPHDVYLRYLANADYIVLGEPQTFALTVEDFVQLHGTLIGTVGTSGKGYFARIYKVNHPAQNSGEISGMVWHKWCRCPLA
jgi:4-amino-4-deoxy-L-arabinose transferase-like glycosyltransferase